MTPQLWILGRQSHLPEMLKKLFHPKAVLEAVVVFHVLVKAKALFLVVLGGPS